MRWEDVKASMSDFWFEFRRERSGLLGLALLLLFVGIALAAPLVAPPETSTRWRDVTYWENYPSTAPPEWVNLFSAKKMPPHLVLSPASTGERELGTIREATFTFLYEFSYDEPPSDMMLLFDPSIEDPDKPPVVVVSVERPDGQVFQLLKMKSRAIATEERLARIVVNAEKQAKDTMITFGRQYEDPERIVNIKYEIFDPLIPLFSEPKVGMMFPDTCSPLKGTYEINATFYLFSPGDEVRDVKLVMGGKVFGLLGTDDRRRDLFAGLIWGTQVSLVVGVVTSILSTGIGVLYGVLSAYLGGFKDELLMRINEIVASIPVLPLLIVIFTVWKPSIWPVILLMGILGWTGTARVVRSMAYQLKEMPYVEAARALGAGGWWIISRHIAPQILPYTFASIALAVPGYILLEAGLSFLGLGDVSRVTWGQILHDAQNAAAAIKGYWWWVVPPGLAIALVGLSFALLGTALNRILSPKLKTL
mgnify:CR=1 FL=1